MHPILNSYFKLIKQFLPTKTDDTSVGIDIGLEEIKLVEIKQSTDSFELINCQIEPILNNEVSKTISTMLSKLSTPCKSPYTSVYGKGTLIRFIEMPKMGIEDLRNSFAIEADKYFPFAQDQIYTDCYIVNDQLSAKKIGIMAAAVKKDMVDKRIEMLTDLGLTAEFIGVNPVAVSNVVNELKFEYEVAKDEAVAHFDIQESISCLCILVNGVPRFTRDIFVGTKELEKRISNALGVSPEEAKILLSSPGDKAADVLNACESSIGSLVQEIKLSFDYFTTEESCELTQLFLSGGANQVDGFLDLLSKELDLKVVSWNPIQPLKISEGLDQEFVKTNASKLAVALGLALYHYD